MKFAFKLVATVTLMAAIGLLSGASKEAGARGDAPVMVVGYRSADTHHVLFDCVGSCAFMWSVRGGAAQLFSNDGLPMSCNELWNIRNKRDLK